MENRLSSESGGATDSLHFPMPCREAVLLTWFRRTRGVGKNGLSHDGYIISINARSTPLFGDHFRGRRRLKYYLDVANAHGKTCGRPAQRVLVSIPLPDAVNQSGPPKQQQGLP